MVRQRTEHGAKTTMRLIFTDLDGSLLDPYSYSFAPAADLL